MRDGQKMTLDVKCNEMPENYAESGGNPERPETAESTHLEQLGIQVENVTPEVAKQLRLKETMRGDHRSASGQSGQDGRIGHRHGDCRGEPPPRENDRRRAESAEGEVLAKGVLLLVRSGEGSRFVVIRVE